MSVKDILKIIGQVLVHPVDYALSFERLFMEHQNKSNESENIHVEPTIDKSSIEKQLVKKTRKRRPKDLTVYSWMHLIITTIFATYFAIVVYRGDLFGIGGASIFKPYQPLLNDIAQGLLGAILFELLLGLDRIILQIILYPIYNQKANITLSGCQNKKCFSQCLYQKILIPSFAPIIFLIPLFTYLRLVFQGSYVQWELYWLPVLNIGMLLWWHYLLQYYFTSVAFNAWKKTNGEHKVPTGSIITWRTILCIIQITIVIISILIVFFLAAYWFEYQPVDLWNLLL
jgi:hypothetical protein